MLSRIAFLGEQSSGKTSLQVRWTTGAEPLVKPSKGRVSATKIKIAGVDQSIWEISPDNPDDGYIKEATMIAYFCSLENDTETNEQAFCYWKTRAEKVTNNVPAILLFTKADIPSPQMNPDQVQAFADRHQISYVITSAKEGTGISQFEECVIEMRKQSIATRYKADIDAYPAKGGPKYNALQNASDFVAGDITQRELCRKKKKTIKVF